MHSYSRGPFEGPPQPSYPPDLCLPVSGKRHRGTNGFIFRASPWAPRLSLHWQISGLGISIFVLIGRVTAGRGRSVLGASPFVPPKHRYVSQQTELHAVAWVIRLAVRSGRKSVTIFSDSERALLQALSLRAKSMLEHQQRVLRSLAGMLWNSGHGGQTAVGSPFPPGRLSF